MKENIYKRTEYYLYNYKNIDSIIQDIQYDIIGSAFFYKQLKKTGIGGI